MNQMLSCTGAANTSKNLAKEKKIDGEMDCRGMEIGRMKMERGSTVTGNVSLVSIPAISTEGKREKGKKGRMNSKLSCHEA